MWKREEPGRTNTPAVGANTATSAPAPATAPAGQSAIGARGTSLGRDVVNIGKSVIIRGELSGSEDLTIEGKVDGKIELLEHVLTIGPHGRIKAQITAKSVVVMGEVQGNISATDKINIRENGSVDGDLTAPRVAIAEGARFRGSIDMGGSATPKPTAKAPAKPAGIPASPKVARVAH